MVDEGWQAANFSRVQRPNPEPTNDIASGTSLLNSYWKQWDSITLANGVLTQVLVNDDGTVKKTGNPDTQKDRSVQ